MLETKRNLFEYLVFLLDKWYREGNTETPIEFTKLRLQKILFLAAATNAVEEEHPLLDVFDRFYALPYGPVELDIYDSMNNNQFQHITFVEKVCDCQNLQETDFEELDETLKACMRKAVDELKTFKLDYLRMPIAELVDITHKWTSWQISMAVADLFGTRREVMSTEDICNSKIKAFA